MVKYEKDRKKERVLHLYMMLTKLRNLIKQSKTKEALELFLRIRSQYKEPLSQEILQDKEKLKKEMLKLYEVINPEALKKIQEQEKQASKNPPQNKASAKNLQGTTQKVSQNQQKVNPSPQKPAVSSPQNTL